MKSLFKISKINDFNLLIEGLEKEYLEYVDATSGTRSEVRSYLYTDSVTLNTIISINSEGIKTLTGSKVNNHTIVTIDNTEIIMSKDGLFYVSHLIIPTNTWLNYILANDPTILNLYNGVYYYNITTNKYYKYLSGVSTEVSIIDILSANYEDPAEGEKGTTIIRSNKTIFIMTKLDYCFNKVSKNLLEALPKTCNREALSSQIFNRDLLWMAINVIKYCINTSNLYEAQRYLEEINRCEILCDGTYNINIINCGCNN